VHFVLLANLFDVLCCMSGPIASILVNKFGCKFVTVLGTLVAACGFIISIFAPNIYFMYFSFGIVAGKLAFCVFIKPYCDVAVYQLKHDVLELFILKIYLCSVRCENYY
jgi:MFS family permease